MSVKLGIKKSALRWSKSRRLIGALVLCLAVSVLGGLTWFFGQPKARVSTAAKKDRRSVPLEVSFLESKGPGSLREIAFGTHKNGQKLFLKVRVANHAFLSLVRMNTLENTSELIAEALPMQPGLPEFIPYGEDVFAFAATKGEVLCFAIRPDAPDLTAFSETLPIESWRDEGLCFDF